MFLLTVISLHSNQTHQLHCLARLSVYVGMRMARLMITGIILGASWTLLLCSLLPPHSSFLSCFGYCVFESFSFRRVKSDQWSFWECIDGNLDSTTSSLEIRDVLWTSLTSACYNSHRKQNSFWICISYFSVGMWYVSHAFPSMTFALFSSW